ncbi:MAG TPA: glycoside hydrolase family 3 C-terminal domain-containing protein [Polyangia bacterium]|nr:glycoside hydrolase family 3 C-terminal domain-containing protein [Polyangia bacterium]
MRRPFAVLVLGAAACARVARPGAVAPSSGGARSVDKGAAESRAAALVARMTLDEKVSQLVSDAPAIPRLGVPAYDWWNEALHGVARSGRATVFPQAIALAATFDDALVRRVAEAIAREARAKHVAEARGGASGRYEGLTFFSPNINIFRDPRWGRGQETYGEDPWLTSRMGVAFIRGLQGEGGGGLAAAATAKHFAAHSGPESLRHGFDARVSAHDLADTYLPQFEAAVREGHVAGVMPAYNRVNGEPCAASPTLLTQTLRGAWGFDGYVVSDCGAIGDLVHGHGAAPDLEHAAALALAAGTDLSCGNEFRALAKARAEGLVTDAQIDRAATRLFATRARLGLLDPPSAEPPSSVVDSPEHRALAREAAREAIVLLENRGGALPLAPSIRRLAVVGPTADDPDVLLGNYHGEPSHAVTPLEGIRAAASARGVTVSYARGAPLSGRGVSSAQLAEALTAAKRSDAVVAVLGLSPRIEGEEGDAALNPSGDRLDLALPRGQQRLLEALVSTGKPVVLVLTAGSALAVPWAATHVPAIVAAWYPGEEGGSALADVLFGDASPAGRLPVTFYRAVTDLPRFDDYAMRGRTYRYFERAPLWAFGHGLSYATFRYTNLVAPATLAANTDTTIGVDVENTSARDADEVVEVYVSRPDAPAYAPRRWLAGFARVRLAANERRAVNVPVPARAFSLVDDHGARATPPGTFRLAVGGAQPDAAWSYAGAQAGLTANVTVTPATSSP